MSFASTAIDNYDSLSCEGNEDTLAAISQDIDAIKADVDELKAQHQRERAARTATMAVSAAARLQKAHEALNTSIIVGEPPHSHDSRAPSQLDFPALGQAKAWARTNTIQLCESAVDAVPRKASYACAATAGMKDAIENNFSSASTRRSKSKISGTLSTTSRVGSSPDARRSPGSYATTESSIPSPTSIIMETPAYEPVLVYKGIPSMANGGVRDVTPRFAQPTKATVRRLDVSLRDRSMSGAPKGATNSTTKSATTKLLQTDSTRHVRQMQAKRKSLPSGWLQDPNKTPSNKAIVPTSTLSIQSRDSDSDWHVVQSSNPSCVITPRKSTTPLGAPPARKKVSTFMSPTAATTQRTIETLGRSASKHTAPRVKQALCVDTICGTPHMSLMSADSAVSTSDSSALSSPCARSAITASVALCRSDAQDAGDTFAISARERTHGSFISQKLISKLPRPTKTPVKGRKASRVPSKAAENVSPSNALIDMPAVPNTTTRRRTSHADILQPILTRLDNAQLLRGTPVPSGTDNPVKHISPRTKTARPKALVDVGILARQGTGKALPPHLRASRASSNTSNATIIVSSVVDTSLVDGSSQVGELDARKPSDKLVHSRDLLAGPIPSIRSSSLRPTADEFTPLWKPNSIGEELGLLSWEGQLDWRSSENWKALPDDVKQSILKLHEFKKIGSQTPGFSSPSKAADRRFWGNVINGEAHDVHAGQVLKPSLSPGKKTVQWTLQEINGQEKPVSFGRAAAPVALEPYYIDPPLISPTSDDTSPIKTPHSNQRDTQAWTIGSAGFLPYGWKGGDGKEISFRGHGPHAERDPNSPVYFQGKTTSYGLTDGRSMRSPETPSSSPKVWPRSRRQWAEMAGYSKVPCGDVEITHAGEYIPLAQPMTGVCGNCAPAN